MGGNQGQAAMLQNEQLRGQQLCKRGAAYEVRVKGALAGRRSRRGPQGNGMSGSASWGTQAREQDTS